MCWWDVKPYSINQSIINPSRSLILIPVESLCAISNWIILNYILSRTVFQLSRSIVKLSPLTKGCLSLTHLFFVISLNIFISHIVPKTRFIGPHFRRRHKGSTTLPSTTLTQLALKFIAFSVNYPKSLYLATPVVFNSPDGGVPLGRSS